MEEHYASQTISSSARELAARENRTRDGRRDAFPSNDGDGEEHSPWNDRRRGEAGRAAHLRWGGASEGGVSRPQPFPPGRRTVAGRAVQRAVVVEATRFSGRGCVDASAGNRREH